MLRHAVERPRRFARPFVRLQRGGVEQVNAGFEDKRPVRPFAPIKQERFRRARFLVQSAITGRLRFGIADVVVIGIIGNGHDLHHCVGEGVVPFLHNLTRFQVAVEHHFFEHTPPIAIGQAKRADHGKAVHGKQGADFFIVANAVNLTRDAAGFLLRHVQFAVNPRIGVAIPLRVFEIDFGNEVHLRLSRFGMRRASGDCSGSDKCGG